MYHRHWKEWNCMYMYLLINVKHSWRTSCGSCKHCCLKSCQDWKVYCWWLSRCWPIRIPYSYNISLSVHAATDSTCEVAQSLEYLLDCCQREQTTRGRGTPKLQITESHLVELLQSHFSVLDIAKLSGCSSKTL